MVARSAAPASAVLSGTPRVWFPLPAPSLLIAQLHFHLCWPIPSFRKVSGFITETGGSTAARTLPVRELTRTLGDQPPGLSREVSTVPDQETRGGSHRVLWTCSAQAVSHSTRVTDA